LLPWTGHCQYAEEIEDLADTGIFMIPDSLLGMGQRRGNWGLLALSASFAAVGSAMVTIITAAARQARWQAVEV
jgi:hypothetical protein